MALKHILGNLPVIRILDFLLDHPGLDYTKSEIAGYTQVGSTVIKKGFNCLEQCGIVTETRRIGGVPLYTLDRENVMTQLLIEFDGALTDYCTDKILEDEGVEEEPDEEYEV